MMTGAEIFKEHLIWSDLEAGRDYDERDAYKEELLKSSTPRKMMPEFFENEYDPRPHRYVTLDDKIKILDFGTETTKDLAHRLGFLNFGIENESIMLDHAKQPEYKYAAYVITNGTAVINRKNIDWKSRTTDFFDGWDSSYHDAQWNGMSALVGYGSMHEEAEKRRNEMIANLIPAGDPSIKRFKLRRLVREGD